MIVSPRGRCRAALFSGSFVDSQTSTSKLPIFTGSVAMKRISLLAAWLLTAFLAGAAFGPAAYGQGVLVWINPPHPIPLPRPIPHPRPTPPPMSYKIQEPGAHATRVHK